MSITWRERLANLRRALGRDPTLPELLDVASIHQMTPAEIAEQQRSWVRAFTTPCEHGSLDWEQCAACRQQRNKQDEN